MKTASLPSSRTTPRVRLLLAFFVLGALALELGSSAFTRVGVPAAPMSAAALVGLTLVPSWRNPRPPSKTTGTRPASGSPPPAPTVIDAAFAPWMATAEILDARVAFPEFLFPALEARLGIFPTGATFLAARFPTPEAALVAAEGYRDFFGMTDTPKSSGPCWIGRRAQARDFASLVCQGDILLAWTARDPHQLADHLAAASPNTAFLS